MALNKTLYTAKLALAVSLAALLSACAGKSGPEPLMATGPTLVDRFDKNGLQTEKLSDYTARAYIEPDLLRADAPDSYTVVRGDTLWDLAGQFLNEPWMWTSVWHANPHIQNPHLIYPGDKLYVENIDGVPTLVFSQNGVIAVAGEPSLGAANFRSKLSPSIRSKSLDEAIPTIPGGAIQQFLIHPMVIDDKTFKAAPYVVANQDNRLVSSAGSQIYARGNMNGQKTNYGIYRKSSELRDPDTGRLLGREIIHVGDAKLLSLGNPSTLMITGNQMETTSGDILLSSTVGDVTHQYVPRIPKLNGGGGRIISLFNAITQSGRDQVVVLNVGESGNIQKGDVLAIESDGRKIVDKHARFGSKRVKLPNVRTGVVMVFKTFEKVSYALVMESTRPVRVNDFITGI